MHDSFLTVCSPFDVTPPRFHGTIGESTGVKAELRHLFKSNTAEDITFRRERKRKRTWSSIKRGRVTSAPQEKRPLYLMDHRVATKKAE